MSHLSRTTKWPYLGTDRGTVLSKVEGFTLVEALVTLGIMATIFSVILFNQADYTAGSSLNNAADEVYVLLRQAQIYGVGVKEFTPGSTEFDVSYGVSFNTSGSGSDDAYIFFADRGVLNQRYDSGWNCPTGGSSECISKTLLTRGITISNVCYVRNNDTESCSPRGADITFKRPDTAAQIKMINSSGNEMSVPNLKAAKIELTSPDGVDKTILIYQTGQISIQ